MNGKILIAGETKMSMHLEGPWLSTTGKKRGKQKFRNADEARKARELDQQWQANKARWDTMAPGFSSSTASTKVAKRSSALVMPRAVIDPARDSRRYPSVDTGGFAAKAAPKIYTGTKVKGIATMHKSNAVPVFSDEEAVDISKMRR